MDQSDLIYICTTVANLAGVPVRIYENGKQCFYHCVVDLPADPVRLHEKQILALADHIINGQILWQIGGHQIEFILLIV